MKKLKTCGRATAEAIANREEFNTRGALRAREIDSKKPWYFTSCGKLNNEEEIALRAKPLKYVVWSYGTPIAWEYTDGTVHIVRQKFSLTTTKHQGQLYLFTDVGAGT